MHSCAAISEDFDSERLKNGNDWQIMFFTKIPVQKVTSESRFHYTVFPYFSYAASSRQSETYQNIHGRFLANLASIYLRERRQKKIVGFSPAKTT